MDRSVIGKTRKRQKSYASGGSNSGIAKPCPTCYTPMSMLPDSLAERSFWTCLRHGRPSKP